MFPFVEMPFCSPKGNDSMSARGQLVGNYAARQNVGYFKIQIHFTYYTKRQNSDPEPIQY